MILILNKNVYKIQLFKHKFNHINKNYLLFYYSSTPCIVLHLIPIQIPSK